MTFESTTASKASVASLDSLHQALLDAADNYNKARKHEIATCRQFSVYRGHPALDEAEARYRDAFMAVLAGTDDNAPMLEYVRAIEAFAWQDKNCLAMGIDIWAGKSGRCAFRHWQRTEMEIAARGYRTVPLRETRNSVPFPRVSHYFPQAIYSLFLCRREQGEEIVLQSSLELRPRVRALLDSSNDD